RPPDIPTPHGRPTPTHARLVWPVGPGRGSAHRQVCPWRHPRTATGTHDARQLEEPLDAVAVPAVGLQELGQSVVIDLPTGQRPPDVLGHVVVPEAHRV